MQNRRLFLGSVAATAAVAGLSACTSMGGFSLTEAVRRLLQLSANRAFDRLLQPEGFWDDQVTRLALPDMVGNGRGDVLARILTGPMFKDRLAHAFNRTAARAARNAAPAVAEAVRGIGIRNALALLHGRPDEATTYLRGEMAGRLIDVMLPEFGDALHTASDPLIGEVMAALTGVNTAALANDLAVKADDAIWRAIGQEEAAIRADPRSTNDPVLIGALSVR
ncbi:DUF4197 family protein [Novosphingobium cyanobacteriorum]|uniref:DUF4197 family protein n=1 Tax=Novosphingobium cyanobacteriorum TaxID=3024215 RepID=A0ABT6CEF4_9SPHN|nr:DUF4197 family protein [Novosphingobium cyanobacteriorum]MDF8332305.1 DUF4197 family protein [Novosphingobium cyanobacteriorum]